MLAKVINKFERTKPHCNIGTIGHVDHGKTTLTAAITKCLSGIGNTIFRGYSDIDNCPEERARGITINAFHVEYETENRHYSHIDCPGHQQYVRNMLVGAAQMDGAILVVAANDGPQVQTREHVILAKEVGILYLLVYINKLDFVTNLDMRDLVELEVRELLEAYSYPDSVPVLGGSARRALEENEPSELGTESVVKLMATVDEYVQQPPRLSEAPFFLWIENTFVIKGRGTVVTGNVAQGRLNINDEIELIGTSIKSTQCLAIEMFRRSLDNAEAGDNVGILIRGIKKDEVSRGNILSAKGFIKPHKYFEAKVYIYTKKEGGRHTAFLTNYKPQFFWKTLNVTGTIELASDVSFVMPGDAAVIKVLLVKEVPLLEGWKFVMREGQLTIGAGRVFKLLK